MDQPVTISDDLIREASLMAEVSERSLSAQIEFWASLGRSLEPLLRGNQVIALRRSSSARALSEAVRDVDTEEGRKRVQDYLDARPFPHFEPVPDSPGLLRKIEADGTVTLGKFVNRVFEPVEP